MPQTSSYMRMKPDNNIEQQLSELKNHYKVPEHYFDNFQVKTNKLSKKQYHLASYKKIWLAAAVLILLVTLGYKIISWSQKTSMTQVATPKQVAQNKDIFNDLTDDEIIDYLIDEVDTDDIVNKYDINLDF